MTMPGRFGTVIGCIDGRYQTRVLEQVMTRFGVRHVDNITSPGAVKELAGEPSRVGELLLRNLDLSIQAHDSRQVAVAAHTDCAGNPVPDSTQKDQLRQAITTIHHRYPDLEAIALFLDRVHGVEKVSWPDSRRT